MKAKVSVGAIVASVALSGVAAIVEPSIRPRWSGAEVGEWTMDYNAAFAAAATNEASRGVVLYFTGLWWCPYCQALETKVLIQQGWQDYVQENQFYLVAIDNLSRTGGNWCWLWDTDYLDEAGLTLQEANQELLDRYLLQTQYATPDATHNTAFDYDQIGYPTMLIFRPGNSAYPMGRTSFPDFSTTSYTVITATANVLQQFDQILATDPEDGKDNYWQGATQLDVSACEDNVTAFGSRTLSPRDTADWYAFESIPNRKWTFAITPGGRGETNNITAAIFVNPAGSAVLSQSFVPSGGTGLTYTTPSAGTYYLRMTRPSGSASVVQGYHLAYSYSEPWKTTVSETCTGPGAMMFTPQLEGGAEMTLLVNGGVVTDDFTDGVACWIAVGPGKHTVVWQTEGFGGASGSVGGVAFVALSQAAPLSPLDKSIVAADAREGFFTWGGDSLPPALSPSYTIYAGPKASALSLGGGPFAETAFPRVGEVAEMDWLADFLAGGGDKTVYWRVDTVIEDAYGRRAETQGKLFSVSLVDAAAPGVDTGTLPPGCAIDTTDGTTVVAPPFTVGVQTTVGPFPLANLGGGDASVAVKNGKLPGGVKVQVLDGALWLTGVPKTASSGKSGTADLVLTERQKVANKTVTVKGTSTRVSWSVAPLGRVAGQYNGFCVADGDVAGRGDVTMTVSATGKLSGKFRHEGVQYSFSAPNFDLIDGGGQFLVTNAVAKAGKAAIGVSLAVNTAGAPEGLLTVGTTESLLYRNNWTDNAPMGGGDALANYLGYYTAALPVETLGGAAAPAGTGYLTLSVGAKGSVKYAGVLADGTSVSGSAVLLYGPDCCSSSDRLMLYLLTVPKRYGTDSGLHGVIQFVPDMSGNPEDVTLVPAHSYMMWVNTDPKSVYGYDATAGVSSEGILGFTNILNVVGGYYAKSMSLVQHYGMGTELTFAPLFGAPPDRDGAQGTSGFDLLSLPVHTNLPMTVTAAAKLAAPAPALVKDGTLVDCEESVNPWGMSFAFKPSTGLFTASFKAYYQNNEGKVQQKTLALSAKGVFVPRRALSADPTDWFGFYLISDKHFYLNASGKTVNYPFKWSYDVRLGEF